MTVPSGWAGFGIGSYAGYAKFSRLYATVARETLTAGNKTDLRTYLGAKAGLVL